MAAAYAHTQRAVTIWIFLSVAAAGVAVAAAFTSPIFFLVAAILVGTGYVFGAMTVRIEDGHLRWWFGPGLWRYERRLADIVSAAPVENPWWWGWGIRATPHGWLYNVSGLGAVEIATADGRTLRIGSDEPDRLSAAIDAARG